MCEGARAGGATHHVVSGWWVVGARVKGAGLLGDDGLGRWIEQRRRCGVKEGPVVFAAGQDGLEWSRLSDGRLLGSWPSVAQSGKAAPSPAHRTSAADTPAKRPSLTVWPSSQADPRQPSMWRDRTNLFISYRQSYAHHPQQKTRHARPRSNGLGDSTRVSEERQGLMSSGAYHDDGDAVIEMDLLPPRWLDVQDEITQHLADIATQTRKLDQLHQKHVLPGFDDEDVKRREERDIEHLTQAITRLFQKCQQALKRIDAMVRDAKQQGSIAQGEDVMAQNLKIALATRVGHVSAMFRKKQAAYLKSETTPASQPWLC